MAFETAIYTDVTAEESVDSMAGFGFQSVSDGIDGTARAVIVEKMLHSISPYWNTSLEETDHPETFAFLVQGDRLYFSRGKSTGRTASGRRGNQITESAVTDDVHDISPYVPAQLLLSSEWTVEKRASKNAGKWFAPLDIPEEFEVSQLVEWVKANPERLRMLGTMMASLEERKTKKTVVVSREIEETLRWFSLLTLLMNRDDAVHVGIRGFTDAPFSFEAPLVAVHPDLMPQRLSGANVFDVENLITDCTATSFSAETCKHWLEKLDEDDALEAIGQFRGWEKPLGAETAFDATTMILDLETEREVPTWSVGISVIRGLIAAELFEDLDLYSEELTDALRGYIPSEESEFVDAAQALGFGKSVSVEGLPEAILDATFEGLFNNHDAIGAWASELLNMKDWDWKGLESFLELLLQLLEVADSPRAKSLLLELANRGARALTREQIQQYVVPAERELLAIEMSNPGQFGPQISSWPKGPQLMEELATTLRAELDNNPTPANRQVVNMVEGRWDYLRDKAQPQCPLTSWFVASDLARTPLKQRADRFKSDLNGVGPDMWIVCLKGASLPEDIDLFIQWARSVDSTTSLASAVINKASKQIHVDPKHAKAKDVDQWIKLLKAVAQSKPHSVQRADALKAMEQYRDEIPNMKERASNMMKSFSNPFRSGRKQR
ncbi:hypothetical protein [Corynebacterium glucuronolyticum]|uniref:Uncharacterized protein n=2 Tax=Corynebacterium glucuronolyticum TaxID=39791 RepID=A0AAX1L846_9CORY|nr:hypothetical protein [Corynebacterium glucuronolyticum]EEI61890.1 hypothetical protein HMPREF0293_2624 [Corynebacterium glucuronolyticum ATCC 51866]QQU88564.1 hypothetical protein I6I68_00725 [Corynebacterium glucuronolyticum]QRP70564.1 hypothetical protein I6J21_12660 [Corynebacterium glucuronolyticum]